MNDILGSFRKNYKGILLIFLASLLTAIGQLLWKISAEGNFMYLAAGFLCYGLGALVMIIAFKFGSLSVLHPMLSIGYVFAIIIGFIYLKEPISILKVTGILFIMLGVVFIGGGDH